MVVVRTKEELQEAIKNKVDSIRIEVPMLGLLLKRFVQERR